MNIKSKFKVGDIAYYIGTGGVLEKHRIQEVHKGDWCWTYNVYGRKYVFEQYLFKSINEITKFMKTHITDLTEV